MGVRPRVIAVESFTSGRTVGVHESGTLVATATSFPSRLAVPGGAVLPMAAVTQVGVRADRTRRGLLTAMVQTQFADFATRGEPVATLRATEARIYGRFGYGVATRGHSTRVRPRGAGWRATAPRGGSVRLIERDDIVATLAGLHPRMAFGRPGGMARPDSWWAMTAGSRIARREHLLAAVHTGPDGDDGFALASIATGEEFVRALHVNDLHATNTAATAGLWRFLLDVDLTSSVEARNRPLDDPLELLLADPRDRTVTGQVDETWLRLVDVPAALAARRFPVQPAADQRHGPDVAPVLLAVHDRLLPDNAGIYRIGDGPAERIGRSAGPPRPDLECDVATLAMAYLGDRLPSALTAVGLWQAHDAAALARADALFATPTVPWCGTFF